MDQKKLVSNILKAVNEIEKSTRSGSASYIFVNSATHDMLVDLESNTDRVNRINKIDRLYE